MHYSDLQHEMPAAALPYDFGSLSGGTRQRCGGEQLLNAYSSVLDRIRSSGFFVLRTPLLPLWTLTEWSEDLESAHSSSDALDVALARDRAVLVRRLREIIAWPEVQESLLLASKTLFEAARSWIDDPESSRGRSAVSPLVRYVVRMASRATPFGLFSGTSLGHAGPLTKLELPARSAYRRHTQLAADYLCSLTEQLERASSVRRHLTYYPSNGLHWKSDSIEYLERRTEGSANLPTYHLVSIELTPWLRCAMESAAHGATIDEVSSAVQAFDREIPADDALAFVESLVESQVLISELAPRVTADAPLDDVLGVLGRIEESNETTAQLQLCKSAMRALDRDGLGLPLGRYEKIAATIRSLPVSVDISRAVHVDMYKPSAKLSLSPAVLHAVASSSELVVKINRVQVADILGRFREVFRERYDDREVPLLEVLDEEIGIGLPLGGPGVTDPSPLVHGLSFPMESDEMQVRYGPRESWIMARLLDLSREGSREWHLSDEDVVALSRTNEALTALPNAFAAVVTIASTSDEAIDDGNFKLLFHGVSGPGGASMFARFCRGYPELLECTRQHFRAEESLQPDAVFAEIVHLPDGRGANISSRALLRKYEVAYLGGSGVAQECRISAADLLVSVLGDRIILRSKRLGKEVVPRLASAHHYQSSVSACYRFLALLQRQWGRSGIAWHWGPFENAPFLPRVTHGRTILSLAQHRLDERDTRVFAKLSGRKLYEAVRELRAARGIPRWVTLLDGESSLTIDFDNVLMVEAFAQLAARQGGVTLREFFPEPSEQVVRGPDGAFTHELVIPFVRREPRAEVSPRAPHEFSVPRTLAPGSEWLYAKLYSGTATADRLLSAIVAPLVERASAVGDISKWFFIRYADPQPHLRVRLHGKSDALYSRVLSFLNELARPFLSSGALWKLQLDTYHRELERYGGDAGMLLCEDVFFADSKAVLAIAGSAFADGGPLARSLVALRGVHRLFLDFGFDSEERLTTIQRIRDGFARMLKADRVGERELSVRFREHRRSIEAALAESWGDDDPLATPFAILRERSRAMMPIVAELRARHAQGWLTTPISELCASLAHMHVNRQLLSDHRRHELVLYDYLCRYYRSERARGRPPAHGELG